MSSPLLMSRAMFTSQTTSIGRIGLLSAAMLLAAGCGPSPPTADAPAGEVDRASAPTQVTLYLAGMNQRLKIL